MLKWDYLLFIDTETSGVPGYFQTPVSRTDQWPFLLQVAWQVYDLEGALIKEENHFIYEPEITIAHAATRVHRITLDTLERKGAHRKAVLKRLVRDLQKFRPLLVGHFVEFDSKMLQVGLHRAGLKNVIRNYRHFCTMQATTGYARFPGQEYPHLTDLYERLFQEKLLNEHDAAVDAAATARCFFELRRRQEITDEMLASQRLFRSGRKRKQRAAGCGLPVLVVLGMVIFMWVL